MDNRYATRRDHERTGPFNSLSVGALLALVPERSRRIDPPTNYISESSIHSAVKIAFPAAPRIILCMPKVKAIVWLSICWILPMRTGMPSSRRVSWDLGSPGTVDTRNGRSLRFNGFQVFQRDMTACMSIVFSHRKVTSIRWPSCT